MHSSKDLPPLEGLNALLAAADTGSFTAAAETLRVTHGSVSRRIAVLEAWLGTSLFVRHGRGVTLTPAGQRFAAEARRTLGDLSRSAEQWRPWRGRQTVRLSVVPSFAKLWLMPRLRSLERDDMHVELIMDHRKTDLDTREADMAIRYGDGRWEGLEVRLLFGETLVPVANPAFAADAGGQAADLLRLPLLHDSDTSQWRAWLGEVGVRYRPRWQDRRFEDYDAVLAAAEAGLGAALLRLPLARAWLDDGRLVRLKGPERRNPAAHFLCARPDEHRSAVMALRDRLLAEGDAFASPDAVST